MQIKLADMPETDLPADMTREHFYHMKEQNKKLNKELNILKVSQSKSPIRARLDYDDQNVCNSESDGSHDADYRLKFSVSQSSRM